MSLIRRCAGAAILVALAAFVWPTPFEVWRGGRGSTSLYRRNRLTGDIQRLEENSGWQSVMQPPPSPPPPQGLPNHALVRVTTSGTWSQTEFSLRVRNQSAWSLDELTVDAWTYNEGTSKAPTIRRSFRLKASPPVGTFSTRVLVDSTDGGPGADQSWNYAVTGALGLPPATGDSRALAEDEAAKKLSEAFLSACQAAGCNNHYQLEGFLERERSLLDACDWNAITTEKELLSKVYGDELDARARDLLALCGRERIADAEDLKERILPEPTIPGPAGGARNAERDAELDRILDDVRKWRLADEKSDAKVSALMDNYDRGPITPGAALEILRSCEKAGIGSVEALRLPTQGERDLLKACARVGITNTGNFKDLALDRQRGTRFRALLNVCHAERVETADSLTRRLMPPPRWELGESPFPGTVGRDLIVSALKAWKDKYGAAR